MAITTIQVDASTRKKLTRLKSSPRETYDEVLNRLMALVPEGDEEGPYTDAFRMGLLEARLDIKDGRLVDHEEVKRRLAL
jgi:predicted transcriptional regulator